MKPGQVFLVGSGPGDPELLTLKAKRVLEAASLVIIDYLANPAHLSHVSPKAKVIFVGKGFRHKKLAQERIHELILKYSKNGDNVVRLKGGDPYLFGRGAEEALFLHENGIPFEVVPGVTSAVACAAYAGIPMTHRDQNATVTFLTGHRADESGLDGLPWEVLAKTQGTLAIYMGFYHLALITRHLIGAGLSPKTPVCVVQWGTLPHQKSCQATLDQIAEVVQKNHLEAPCMIFIGQVVTYRKKLNWYENLPLFGKKILVTRMQEKSSQLKKPLEWMGATVFDVPTIQIKKIDPNPKLKKVWRQLSQIDWIIFTSEYGVHFFMQDLLGNGLDARDLKNIQFATASPKCQEALAQYGLVADLTTNSNESLSIIQAFKKEKSTIRHKNIYLFRTAMAPDHLDRQLIKMGAKLHSVPVYKTLRSKKSKSFVHQTDKEALDLAIFTSSSAVKNFAKIYGLGLFRRLVRQGMKLVSIGPMTTQSIRSLGFDRVLTAKEYSIDGLIKLVTAQGKIK